MPSLKESEDILANGGKIPQLPQELGEKLSGRGRRKVLLTGSAAALSSLLAGCNFTSETQTPTPTVTPESITYSVFFSLLQNSPELKTNSDVQKLEASQEEFLQHFPQAQFGPEIVLGINNPDYVLRSFVNKREEPTGLGVVTYLKDGQPTTRIVAELPPFVVEDTTSSFNGQVVAGLVILNEAKTQEIVNSEKPLAVNIAEDRESTLLLIVLEKGVSWNQLTQLLAEAANEKERAQILSSAISLMAITDPNDGHLYPFPGEFKPRVSFLLTSRKTTQPSSLDSFPKESAENKSSTTEGRIIEFLNEIKIPELDENQLIQLSLKLAEFEYQLAKDLNIKITRENFSNFFNLIAPKILKIYNNERLSYGIWENNVFKAQPRDRLPEILFDKDENMNGASAQTNYRKSRIRFNLDSLFFWENNEAYPPSIVFLIAHELAHYTGTNDEFSSKDNLTHESAAQLLALEVLCRGYFEYKEEDPQLAQIMLMGFLRTLRNIIDKAAFYRINQSDQSSKAFEEYQRYINQLPVTEQNKNQNNKTLNSSFLYYYGELPFQILLDGKKNQRLLGGNPEKQVDLTCTKALLPSLR